MKPYSTYLPMRSPLFIFLMFMIVIPETSAQQKPEKENESRSVYTLQLASNYSAPSLFYKTHEDKYQPVVWSSRGLGREMEVEPSNRFTFYVERVNEEQEKIMKPARKVNLSSKEDDVLLILRYDSDGNIAFTSVPYREEEISPLQVELINLSSNSVVAAIKDKKVRLSPGDQKIAVENLKENEQFLYRYAAVDGNRVLSKNNPKKLYIPSSDRRLMIFFAPEQITIQSDQPGDSSVSYKYITEDTRIYQKVEVKKESEKKEDDQED